MPMNEKLEWTPDLIRSIRQDMGLTQTQFADAVGIARQQTISEWEVGTYHPSRMAEMLLNSFVDKVKALKKTG